MVLQDYQMPLKMFLHGLCCWAVDSLHRSAFWGSPRLRVSISESLERAGCWESLPKSSQTYTYIFYHLGHFSQLQVCFCLQWPHLWLFFGNNLRLQAPLLLQGRVSRKFTAFSSLVVLNWWPQVQSARALHRCDLHSRIPGIARPDGNLTGLFLSALSPSFTDFS